MRSSASIGHDPLTTFVLDLLACNAANVTDRMTLADIGAVDARSISDLFVGLADELGCGRDRLAPIEARTDTTTLLTAFVGAVVAVVGEPGRTPCRLITDIAAAGGPAG